MNKCGNAAWDRCAVPPDGHTGLFAENLSDLVDKDTRWVVLDRIFTKSQKRTDDMGNVTHIPSRSNATRKAYCPKRFYRRRHKIENYFCRIKDWRRIATRYDKLARNFLAAAALVGALYWIKL